MGQDRKGSGALWGGVGQNKALGALGMETTLLLPPPFSSQGRPVFSSLLLPATLSASSPYTPVFLLLRAHSDSGHASPLLYAVLVPGSIVTDQKAWVPVPDALAREAGCLSLGRERAFQ